MNAGLNGLPDGAQGQKIMGLVRGGSGSGISMSAAAACALSGSVASTATDINALNLAYSATGRGVINWLGTWSGQSSGNFRAVVEIDGVRVFDQTRVIGGTNQGIIIIGGGDLTGATYITTFQRIPYSSSVRVWLSSSVSGVGLTSAINAEVYA